MGEGLRGMGKREGLRGWGKGRVIRGMEEGGKDKCSVGRVKGGGKH